MPVPHRELRARASRRATRAAIPSAKGMRCMLENETTQTRSRVRWKRARRVIGAALIAAALGGGAIGLVPSGSAEAYGHGGEPLPTCQNEIIRTSKVSFGDHGFTIAFYKDSCSGNVQYAKINQWGDYP